uniref:Autophagy-related protein 2 n=1 Tax=Davidia involucrata TaxID=16924 RepID=A0A5B6ZZ23_DAVIN
MIPNKFPWNIAQSAEAMFSRWAIKRVCKFLLKKKLGQFILGDIDLDQLDVQLTNGTIQLSDLVINVDYLNQKFGAAAAVIVKEGSIGSLLVTMPWKGKGCQIEVDELELVLAPFGVNNSQVGSETYIPCKDDYNSISHDLGKLKYEMMDDAVTSAPVDVHEGVKTIAKMVKWLLTSFHVKVKRVIVAFDPCLGEEKYAGFCKTLVFRITEAECGTCISEDINSNSDVTVDAFLGLSRLTNFIKFQGAILEFLQMDGIDNQTPLPCASGTTFDDWFSGCCPSNATTPIVTGERGGFSGTLKLSIPWKNGSLDIRKVDADAYIDPLEVMCQPSTIKWFLYLREIFKDLGKNKEGHLYNKRTESVYFNAASHCHSSTLGSSMIATEKVDCETSSADFCLLMGKETDALLPGSHLIPDWVSSSISKNKKDRTEEEPYFGASIDQFFECFDEMRNSQSALGNSGMWNWTCSVFSAITAASNLASGSLHMPTEQQHVETNLKATVAGISFFFSFLDEDQKHLSDLKGDQMNVGSNVHYLGAKCKDMLLVLQVCPREMNFEATIEHIELTDNFSNENGVMDFGLHGCNDDIESQIVSIQQLQAAVLGALPSFSSSAKDGDLKKPSGSVATDFLSGMSSMNGCISRANSISIYKDDVVKVMLLRTSGVSQCQFTINSSSSGDSFTGPTSFSLKLPQFVSWVNFHLINMVLDLLNEVGSSFEMNSTKTGFASKAFNDKYSPSSHGDLKSNSCPHVPTLSPKENLRGNILLPNARIIICFPSRKVGNFRSYTSWDQFIALDFSSPSNLREEKVQVTNQIFSASSWKRYSSTASRSLHLNVGNLEIYLITSSSKDDARSNSCGLQRHKLLAQKILSVSNEIGRLSVLSMLWREGPVTGPWIAKRAKILATSEDLRSRNKFMGKGYEFASVTSAKDMEDFNTRTRQEMILSSSFFLHAHLSCVRVNLGSFQYKTLHCLLHQVIDGLSCVPRDPVGVTGGPSACQTSILVECDSVEISISLEKVESIKGSIRNELPGSWHSLKLQIQKFELLSISNIGGIGDANFLWVAHGEGNLWGSITGENEELLLISCSNSTRGRGDGEGSNVLSSRFSGSDIIHLWDPESFHSYTSVTVRCGTIVAIGGRLDWLDTIFSFFSLSSPEIEQAGDNSPQEGEFKKNVPCGSSFVLNLVDIGLSYEPYLKNLVVDDGFKSKSGSANVNEETGEKYVACLLAASSLKLSNKTGADSVDSDYKIRVQDLGLLLCPVSAPELVGGMYDAEHLHKIGYVKVAREAHVEALLRMNCKNDLLWEVESSESHIFLETCHDSTSGLIRLAAQLQQLFAPDIEESVVHLQSRWNNVQRAQESNETRIFNNDSGPSTSEVYNSSVDTKSKPDIVNLMDEICDDAFHLDRCWDGQSDFCESQLHISLDDSLLGEACNLSVGDPASCSHNLSFTDSEPVIGFENSQTSLLQNNYPEFIEGYFLSELCPLSQLSLNNQSLTEILKCKSRNVGNGDGGRGNNGWYGDASLRIVENHVSEITEQAGQKLFVEGDTSSGNHTKPENYGKARGCILLKNINVIWRMYAGSDWRNFPKNVPHSGITRGRDTTVCLELALSGMDFRYDIFPDGEICVSRLSLSVQDFHLNDNSNDAPWKLVLGDYHSKDHPRESSSKAFKLDLEAVRPDPSTPLEEYRLRIAFLPMLLHLHQCQLDFLISFFGGSSVDQPPSAPQDSGESQLLPKKSSNFGGHTISEEALLPYFQKFDIWPVLVRVDYSPCRVDLAALRGGKYVELVNLVPWKGVELQLKHVHAFGVYGWSSVCETIIGEWLEDISQNQIHKLLQGLPPIRSLVAVGSGAAKLVSLPVNNYRKDHRLLKGMQRGTITFLRSISLEAVGLGVHLAAGAHDILQQAEYILTGIPSSVPWPVPSRKKTNVRSNQPKDARQGMQQAYESITDGLGKSASALVRTPLKRYQRGAGAGSALATAVQAAPAAVVAPASWRQEQPRS